MQKEINDLLERLEKDLLSFVSFIKNAQEEYKNLSYSQLKDLDPLVRKEIFNNSDDETYATDSTAIVEAFNFVKNVLLRICNLIDLISSLPADGKQSFEKADTYLVRHYYSKYVYQIAAYLVKTVEEHLSDLSEKLEQSTSPKLLNKKSSESLPSKVRCKTNYRRKDSSSSSSESTSDEDCEIPRDDSAIAKRSPYSGRENETDVIVNRLVDSLNELATVVEDFLLHLEESSFSKCISAPLSKKAVRNRELSFSKQINKCRCSSPSSPCDLCCESCKSSHNTQHKDAKNQNTQAMPLWPILITDDTKPLWMRTTSTGEQRHDSRKVCSACKVISRKGDSMTSRRGNSSPIPAEGSTSKKHNEPENTSGSETLSKSEPIPSPRTEPSQSYEKDAERCPTSDGNTRKILVNVNGSIQEKTVERIFPGRHTRRLSAGKLKRTSPNTKEFPVRRKAITPPAKGGSRMEPITVSRRCSPSKSGEFGKIEEEGEDERKTKDSTKTNMSRTKHPSQKEGGEVSSHFEALPKKNWKPIFASYIKEAIITKERSADKFGGFCLLPQTYQASDGAKATCFCDNKEGNTTGKYPRFLTFDVAAFSLTLESKFADLHKNAPETARKAEPDLILGMLYDSVEEATEFYEDAASETTVGQVLDQELASRTSEGKQETEDLGKEPSEKDKMFLEKPKTPQACELCLSMMESSAWEDAKHRGLKRSVLAKPREDSCPTCGYGLQRGLTIHQCHDSLPPGVLEVRHMDSVRKICVCLLFWDRLEEQEDWRWFKSPFHDPTRVELEQEATPVTEPVLKVIFGPEGNMVKESLAETRLPVVTDFPNAKALGKAIKMDLEEAKCASTPVSMSTLKTQWKQSEERGRKKSVPSPEKKNVVTKLARFFDDIQKVGYGRGPPLVIKIRRDSAVNDAFDLLMAPSRIRLNYYRSLRALFISKSNSRLGPSSTNFIEEDESDELFELFSRALFQCTDKCLFDYPSEETQFLYLNPEASVNFEWFAFAGAVLALAILHHKKLNVKLPSCLFKCLLDRPVNMVDLQELDPMFYQNLMWIKENDITTHKRKFTFTIRDRVGEKMQESELIPNGGKITVTESNKFRYITLAVKWKLAERCLTQLKDFRRGFASVIEPGFLTIFSEKELQSLIRDPPEGEIFLNESFSGRTSYKAVTRRETL